MGRSGDGAHAVLALLDRAVHAEAILLHDGVHPARSEREPGEQRCAGAGVDVGVVTHMISCAMAVRTERRGRRLRSKWIG